VYFEVDQDFKPQFVEYRRLARAEIGAKPAEKVPGAIVSKPKEGTATSSQSGHGPTRFIDAIVYSESRDNSELPFEIPLAVLRANSEIEIENNRMKGRLAGFVDTLKTGADPRTKQLVVPEGYHLVQLRVNSQKAQSLPGKTFDYVAGAVNQYQA